jgi:hypothetical protein
MGDLQMTWHTKLGAMIGALRTLIESTQLIMTDDQVENMQVGILVMGMKGSET